MIHHACLAFSHETPWLCLVTSSVLLLLVFFVLHSSWAKQGSCIIGLFILMHLEGARMPPESSDRRIVVGVVIAYALAF